jgi:ribonuclease BN (tRNA processing enzyme)
MTLSLTVLGSSATYPRPHNPCSGFLLSAERATIWIDCGPGTFAALQEYINPQDLTAVWVSHLHPDHCADLLSLFNWSANSSDANQLPVYGPSGWVERLAAMLPMDDAARTLRQAFKAEEIEDGGVAIVGDVSLTSRRVQHGVPAYGLRIASSNRVVTYSGDTGPCAALVELAMDADLFICEAGAQTAQRDHCTPSDAGLIASTANSHQLVLTHIADGITDSRAAADAGSLATCPVQIARPGQQIAIRPA